MKTRVLWFLSAVLAISACKVTPESTRQAQSIASQTSLAGNAGARALCAEGLVLRPSSAQPGAALVCLPAGAPAAPH